MAFSTLRRPGKGLAAQGHHVRHSVDVDRLIFVGDSPANVAHFQDELVGQLPLDSEVKRIHHVRAEVRIQGFAGGSRDVVDARESRLRKSWRAAGIGALLPSVPMRKALATVRQWTSGDRTSPVHIVVAALDGLDKSGTKQRHQHEIHAIQTAIDSAIAAADDSLAPAKEFAEESIVKIRIPSCGKARAE